MAWDKKNREAPVGQEYIRTVYAWSDASWIERLLFSPIYLLWMLYLIVIGQDVQINYLTEFTMNTGGNDED